MKKIWFGTVFALLLVFYAFIELNPSSEDVGGGKIASNSGMDENPLNSVEISRDPSSPMKDVPTASQAQDEIPALSASDAILGMIVPLKPVDSMLGDFLRNPHPSLKQKMDLVSALSFCVNRRGMVAHIGEARSQGSSSEDYMNSLNATYEDYLQYCGGLPDSAYSMRRDILGALAAQGDADARAMYFEVGPLGRWPEENEYLPMSAEQVDQWVRESAAHLAQISRAGDFRAYKTLAAIHGSTADDPILGRIADKVKAYSYDYLWATSVAANPETSTDAKKSVAAYLKRIEAGLTAEQREEGRRNALSIHMEVSR